MKVLLLNPSSRGTFRIVGILFPPIGLLYVAAATRARGHKVEVVDRSVDRRKIDFSSFDVVGVHSDTTRFERALELARQAKAAGARVVMGGPHPCFMAEQILETGAVDAIVRGEGEETFPDLLEAWENGADPTSIEGLILLSSQGVLDGGERERIQDVDGLPFPARDLLDLSSYDQARMGYRTITPIHTSRGCPYRCRFCASTHFDGARWRARSSESVLGELEYIVRELGYGAVAFMDDNFTFSPARIHEICDGILKRGFDLHWWCFSRVDTIVRHPEMVQHMAEAGARSMFVGVETPSLKVLDRFHKGIDPYQAVEAVQILKHHGIEIWASYILGAPEENRGDLRATIRFARELDTNTAEFTLLTPYPGTEIYEELKNQITVKSWEKYDGVHSVYRHPCIPRMELQAWLVWANISFYFRHSRSTRNFFRFLSNRKFGGQIISQAISSRKR
jgi:anaerobic magnesium-protoporphyrin IX monomethyl ester cyclase